MQTMDAHLAQLVRMGRITRKLAEQRASVPEELKRLLGSTGEAPTNGADGAKPAAVTYGG
jgi:Tfp pilus assembly ATPase PilU